jgi:hypothetical protein
MTSTPFDNPEFEKLFGDLGAKMISFSNKKENDIKDYPHRDGSIISPLNMFDKWQCPCGVVLNDENAIKVIGEIQGHVYRVGMCADCAEKVAGFLRVLEQAHENNPNKRHGS